MEAHFPSEEGCSAAHVIEVVLTVIALQMIVGTTDRLAPVAYRRADWPLPAMDPPDQHPLHRQLGEPDPQDRRGRLGGRSRDQGGGLTKVAGLLSSPKRGGDALPTTGKQAQQWLGG